MSHRSVAAPEVVHAVELAQSGGLLALRLMRGPDGLWCERHAQSAAGTSTLHCLVDDAQQLRRFLAADPWGDRLHAVTEPLIAALPTGQPPEGVPPPRDAADALALVATLAQADAGAALRRIRAVARFLGFESGALLAARAASDGTLALELAAACDPSWAQLYLGREHFRDDALWRAATSSARCWMPAGVLRLAGDAERVVHDTARRLGFAARIAVPAPAVGRHRRAVLFLGHPDSRMELLPAALQGIARELAIEAAQWTLDSLRRREIGSVEFSEIECRLLELYDRRVGDREIAACLGEPEALVRARFWRLAGKLKAKSRDDALERSFDYGLLAPRSLDLPL